MFCGHHFACTWAVGGGLWMSNQSKKWSRWETSLVIPCIASSQCLKSPWISTVTEESKWCGARCTVWRVSVMFMWCWVQRQISHLWFLFVNLLVLEVVENPLMEGVFCFSLEQHCPIQTDSVSFSACTQ